MNWLARDRLAADLACQVCVELELDSHQHRRERAAPCPYIIGLVVRDARALVSTTYRDRTAKLGMHSLGMASLVGMFQIWPELTSPEARSYYYYYHSAAPVPWLTSGLSRATLSALPRRVHYNRLGTSSWELQLEPQLQLMLRYTYECKQTSALNHLASASSSPVPHSRAAS